MAQMGHCIVWEHHGSFSGCLGPPKAVCGLGGGQGLALILSCRDNFHWGVGGSWLRWEWGLWQGLGLISGIGGRPHPCHWASPTGVRP